jgi:hypothetical protein
MLPRLGDEDVIARPFERAHAARRLFHLHLAAIDEPRMRPHDMENLRGSPILINSDVPNGKAVASSPKRAGERNNRFKRL